MARTKQTGRRIQPGLAIKLAAAPAAEVAREIYAAQAAERVAVAQAAHAVNLAAGDTDLVAVLRHLDHGGKEIVPGVPMVQRTYRSVFSGHVRIRSAPTTANDNQTGHIKTGEEILVREVRTDGFITWLRLEPEGGVERWSMLKYRSSTRAFYDLVPLQG